VYITTKALKCSCRWFPDCAKRPRIHSRRTCSYTSQQEGISCCFIF